MKPGDLVKRKGCEWYAIILSVKPKMPAQEIEGTQNFIGSMSP